MRQSSGARITLTLELGGLGSWGPECTVAQVHKQASEAALNRLEHLLRNSGDVRLLGRPVVTLVTAVVETDQ